MEGSMREYAVYKGEEIQCIGTVDECAAQMGVQADTIRYYASPKYLKKVEARKKSKNFVIAIKLDDEEE
jgi:hypothetical protein